VRRLAVELRECLPACCRKPDVSLTRGEMATVFTTSTRSIARWEAELELPAKRENARVLRYEVESAVLLLSLGYKFDREAAFRFGLIPDALLALADKHAQATMPAKRPVVAPMNPVLIAEDEDDRDMLSLWRDPVKGSALRQLVRVMTNRGSTAA
jgi:hypothetical protein